MADWEKVIKGLECLSSEEVCYGSDCPYYDFDCTQKIAQDALELLKKQEERIKKFELERSWDENPDTMGKW